MPKSIDKTDLLQYRYFHDLIQNESEWQEIVSDAMAGEHTMRSTNKRDRIDGMMMFNRAVRKIPESLYLFKEDQERCRQELAVKDLKQKERKADQYLDIALALPFFQGKPIEKQQFLSEKMQEAMPAGQLNRIYQVDKKTGRYYQPCTSVPKLLLVDEELFQEKSGLSFTEEEKESLEALLTEDVHYIVCVQSESQSEKAYMVEIKQEKPTIQMLERYHCSSTKPIERFLLRQNDQTAVLLCLREYLMEIRQAEEQRKKYLEEHPGSAAHSIKEERIPKYVDKSVIKVLDIRDQERGTTFDGGIYYLKRHENGNSHHAAGYEMVPHTRKGHYRTYKNGKTVYVKSSVIHKEKYEGMLSAHRIGQDVRPEMPEEQAPEQQEPENGFTMGMSM